MKISPWSVLLLILTLIGGAESAVLTTDDVSTEANFQPTKYRGVMVAADQVNSQALSEWKQKSLSIVLQLTNNENSNLESLAAKRIVGAGLPLEYWIEVGRCPELAAEHPEWMASLQGHPEWRKQFPDVPQPNEQQVIKNQPWVPILYRESFDAHLIRIEKLLADKPPASRLWLNDLQAGPSACGCGHPLCRWAADYGPIHTATPLDHRAAAQFVSAIEEKFPAIEVVPIFVGECEAEDKHSICCGVNCFEGRCWREFTKQLDALSAVSPRIGVGCFYRAFERDLKRYEDDAGWVNYTLKSFSQLPPKRGGVGVPSQRLIAVLQGWDVTSQQISAQQTQAASAGAEGWLLVQVPIDQSWQPVLFDWK